VAERIRELTEEAVEHWRWRRSRPVACVWRGDWGSSHSLAIVNDGHATALERDAVVVRRTADAPQSQLDAVGVAGHWPPRFDAPSGGPYVLYQPWEFGRVPARWVDEIRRGVDEVWTPSEYARAAYVESGVAPELVHVVPNGVDVARFSPDGPALELPTRKGTVFLFVGGTLPRKGIDVLLEGYARAFTAADDVALVLKVMGRGGMYRDFPLEQLLERHRTRPDAPELVLFDDDVPFEELPALYRAADVLVQPYRGEGFCLPALEALACAVPVIVTAGGPTDEFVSDACAWRVDAARTPYPADGFPEAYRLVEDGFLLDPDPDALAAAFREAADPDERALRAGSARDHARRLSWERAADAAADRIAALAGRRPIRTVAPAVVAGRRRVLFAVAADWSDRETWLPAVRAYADAFDPTSDTTLVLPAADEQETLALVGAELDAAGIDTAGLADIVLADAAGVEAAALELAADAVIHCRGPRPTRAAAIVPPDPTALRAVAERGD
jgi:glycosyltransferase involved in cell wall biosynthesis